MTMASLESLPHKLLTTALIYFLFLQLAIRFGIFGPTILDLGKQLAVTQSQMSLAFSVTSIGVCIGAISSGFVFKWVPKQLALASLVVMLGIIVSFVTSIYNYYLFLGLQLVIGITSGAAINGCEAWILEIWEESCPPYMQALQFFRGLGYILGPIIVEPFLSPEDDDDIVTTTSATATTSVTKLTDRAVKLLAINVSTTQSTVTENEDINHIYIPFMINGLMLVLAAVLVFFQYLYTVRQLRQSANIMAISSSQDTIVTTISCDEKVPQEVSEEKPYDLEPCKLEEDKPPKLYTYTIIILCSVFYLFFFEEVVVTYLASFSTNISLHLTKSAGAFLTSIFNLANVIGKAIGIVLSIKLKHWTMLYMNLIIIIISLVILIIFSNTSLVMLWTGVCLLGVGLSSIIASLYALMESSVTMNSMVCGILNMSGTLGSVFVPLAIASYIESYPLSLMWASLLCALSCVVTLIAIQIVIKFRHNRLHPQPQQLIEDKPVFKF